MSAYTAVLIQEISATWLKNAFAFAAGALVLLALSIVFP
jgi:zinc transporter ZupT